MLFPQVFFDLTINGEPAGRITVELLADAPAGASRFASLAAGRQGVDYRLSKFNGVLPVRVCDVSKSAYGLCMWKDCVDGCAEGFG